MEGLADVPCLAGEAARPPCAVEAGRPRPESRREGRLITLAAGVLSKIVLGCQPSPGLPRRQRAVSLGACCPPDPGGQRPVWGAQGLAPSPQPGTSRGDALFRSTLRIPEALLGLCPSPPSGCLASFPTCPQVLNQEHYSAYPSSLRAGPPRASRPPPGSQNGGPLPLHRDGRRVKGAVMTRKHACWPSASNFPLLSSSDPPKLNIATFINLRRWMRVGKL